MTATFNSDTNSIYFHNGYVAGKITLHQNENKAELLGPCDVGRAPKATVIDGDFHLIGYNLHMKYDESAEDWQFVANIEYSTDSDEEEEENKDGYGDEENEELKDENSENHGMVQVKDKLLVFGGHYDDLFSESMNEWNFSYTDSVRQYDIKEEEWTKLNIKVPNGALMGYGTVSILDGEYVAVFGGNGVEDGSGWGTNEISIYSVKNQTFKMSKIVCPKGGSEWQAISVRGKDSIRICEDAMD